MRMLFDQGSANKMQSQYMGRLSKLEKDASAMTARANNALMSQHRTLVKNLEAENDAASKKLEAKQKTIATQVSANAKKAMEALKPDARKLGGRSSAEYKQQEAEYNAMLEKMQTGNAKYVAKARQLGLKARAGERFSSSAFLKNEAADRRTLIGLQEQQVNKTIKGTAARKAAVLVLNEMRAAHKMMEGQERKYGALLAKNMKLMQASQSTVNRLISLNNARYKEQIALLGRINGAIQRVHMQLSGAFMNAIMASGIALMTFAFRLQGLIATFQEFEKELMNAQSIFQTTNEVLFSLSDEIVKFGTQYGISLGTASEGLYTLASAGLSATDSQEVLANTLKLSMAVQGDHDTIAKLTTQTIFGFGLAMSESAALTDKFAHAINMSLIEYQDLASAVKFAMPFFVSTGQNIDQLLGSLQVLTNRALEAGIAGRGLRQALAEFAQHAEDNTAAFRKMGVEIMNTDGSFKLLTEIAREFSEAMGPAASDVDLMTTLLEDLNVRGATAFVHLVQNADEFESAVNDLSNSAGSATRMAEIQQQSLANQIQVIKNALMAPFLLSDEVGRANGTMNEFGQRLHNIAKEFEAFFIKRLPDGTAELTKMGEALRQTVLSAVQELTMLIKDLLILFTNLVQEGNGLSSMFHALMLPLRLIVQGINLLGDGGVQAILMFKALNAVLPITEAHTIANMLATTMLTDATMRNAIIQDLTSRGLIVRKLHVDNLTLSMKLLTGATMAANLSMMFGSLLLAKEGENYQRLGMILIGLAGAFTAAAIAKALFMDPKNVNMGALGASAAAGFVIAAGMAHMMKEAMTPPKMDIPTADMGMRMYDMGGKASLGGRHFPVMVEPGETIISKTQNMMGGGGITLNIGGDIVTDNAEDFADRIAEVLPEALRRQSDIGGI